jgi:hypothetical protein
MTIARGSKLMRMPFELPDRKTSSIDFIRMDRQPASQPDPEVACGVTIANFRVPPTGQTTKDE